MIDSAESVFVEIRCHDLNTSVIIGEIYRPPQGNITVFIHNFSQLLACLADSNTKAYIMEDYNLDLAKYPHHQPAVDLIMTLTSFSFMPLVNRTTRATHSSLTVIDNIFTNDMNSALISETRVVTSTISDHFLIWHNLSNYQPCNDQQNQTTFYLINENSTAKFLSALANTDWPSHATEESVNEAFENFYNHFIQIFLAHF